MLTVYSKETTSFSTLGIGALKDFTANPIITEELNGAYTLEFSYAKDGYLSEYLIEQNIVKANGQAFRIWNVKKDMKSITILAKHIFFDLSFNFLDDVYPKNLTAQGALSWLLNHAETPTNFTASGNCTSTSNARYVRKNIVDAIYNEDNALLNRFGGELSFNNFAITVNEKRGTDANFSIRYKKNLTGIDFNLDFSNVATRIIPIGFDGLTIDSLYVESPKVGNYFTPLYKTYEFGDIKYDPDDEEAYHTLAEAKQALTNAANDLFNKEVDLPSISIKVNFVELAKCTEYENYSNLEAVHLGDTIGVIIPELNINTTARVVKTIYDCFLKRFTTLEIGSVTPSATTNQIQVNNQVKKTENYINEAQKNAENLINHPFNGNLYIDNTPGSGVIYFMDTTNPATAQSIWKWSIGGLGYSPNGINGTYTIGITQDGRINADFITTGHLNTSVIEGYESLVLQVTENTNNLITTNSVTSSTNQYNIPDALENGLVRMSIDGKSEQDETPTPTNPSKIESVGYENLFDANNIGNTNIIVEDEGRTIKLPIVSSGNGYISTGKTLHQLAPNIEVGDIVYLKFNRNLGTTYNNFIYLDGTGTTWLNNTSKEVTQAMLNSNVTMYANRYQDGETEQCILSDFRLIKDAQEQYIPFGKYGIEYKTVGKNLYNKDTITENYRLSTTGEPYGDNSYNLSDYIEVLPNTNYVFNLARAELYNRIAFYDNNKTIIGLDNSSNRVILTPSNAKYMRFGWLKTEYSGLQLEQGSASSQYEPYEEQTTLIQLDEPLRSIGNVKDKLRIENGILFVDRNIRHVELAIADMNNNQTYPGWMNKPGTQQMSKDYPNKNGSLTTYGILWQCNIFPSSKSPNINTMSSSGIIFISRNQYDYSETQWKTLYPDLVFKFDYVMPSTETEELGTIDIPMLENTNNIDIYSNLITDSAITYSKYGNLTKYIASSIKMTTDGIETQVQENSQGLNSANFNLTAQGARLDVISTNIDPTNGDINSVKTKDKGFTFDDNGLTITNSENGYKRVADETGDRYYDGNAETGEYTKDGSKQKDLSLFGSWKYCMKNFNDIPRYVGQQYTTTIRGESRTGFGHFKNS